MRRRPVLKTCTKCEKSRGVEDFHYVRGGPMRNSQCRICVNAARRRVYENKKTGTFVSKVRQPRLTEEQREERREEQRIYQIKYRQTHKKRLREQRRLREERSKREGIDRYGGKCSCCGEARFEFLTLEHLNGRADETRRLTGKQAWYRLKNLGWPEGYTVLCFNCNCTKGIYGTCPHTWEDE